MPKTKEEHPDWRTERPYAPPDKDEKFEVLYTATCHCGAVKYEVKDEPLQAVYCHCTTCQNYHGCPCQWAAVFDKESLRFDEKSLEHLKFYNLHEKTKGHTLPCKVSCGSCGSLIADEGRNKWMAFPALFHFGGGKAHIPVSFQPTNHIFYGQRVIDLDGSARATYWEGAKEDSEELTNLGQPVRHLRSHDVKRRKVEDGKEDDGEKKEGKKSD